MPSVLPSTRSEEKLGTREITIYIVLSSRSITCEIHMHHSCRHKRLQNRESQKVKKPCFEIIKRNIADME